MNSTATKAGQGPERLKIILILGFLTAYVPFSIDSYLPALTNSIAVAGMIVGTMLVSLTLFLLGRWRMRAIGVGVIQ